MRQRDTGPWIAAGSLFLLSALVATADFCIVLTAASPAAAETTPNQSLEQTVRVVKKNGVSQPLSPYVCRTFGWGDSPEQCIFLQLRRPMKEKVFGVCLPYLHLRETRGLS